MNQMSLLRLCSSHLFLIVGLVVLWLKYGCIRYGARDVTDWLELGKMQGDGVSNAS